MPRLPLGRRAPLAVSLLTTMAAVAGVVSVVAPLGSNGTAEAASPTPPVCPTGSAYSSPRYFRCNRYTAIGHRGSIGLLGDSVLLGSADGASDPGLPSLLSGAGWGPINLISTLGMRTYWPVATAQHENAEMWVHRWHTAGWYPSVVAVNLGSDQFGTCKDESDTTSSLPNCTAVIARLLDAIGPSAAVWWSKVNHVHWNLNDNYIYAQRWNRALDQLAARRTNLVVWDWPTALATSNPKILMDAYGIHPTSAKEYVKRSRLMLAHIDTYMPAHFAGPRVALPATAAAHLRYTPVANPAVGPSPALAAATRTEIDLTGQSPPTGSRAVALSIDVLNPAAAGGLTAWDCGASRPATLNVTFAAHQRRTALALVRLSATNHVCLYAGAASKVTLTVQGWFGTTGDVLVATSLTRSTLHPVGGAFAPMATVAGDAVTVDLTVVGGAGAGTVGVAPCGGSAAGVTVAYGANQTVTGSGFVRVPASRTICLVTTGTPPATVVADRTHVFRAPGTGVNGLGYTPITPLRLLDTRTARGGWYGRHVAKQVLSVVAAPAGITLATVAVSSIAPLTTGAEKAYACGAAPATTTVATDAHSMATGATNVAVRASDHLMCITTSQNTNTVVDLVGWWS